MIIGQDVAVLADDYARTEAVFPWRRSRSPPTHAAKIIAEESAKWIREVVQSRTLLSFACDDHFNDARSYPFNHWSEARDRLALTGDRSLVHDHVQRDNFGGVAVLVREAAPGQTSSSDDQRHAKNYGAGCRSECLR